MILSPTLLSPAASLLAVVAYGLALAWPVAPADAPPTGAPVEPKPSRMLGGLLATGWLLQAVVLLLDVIDWQAQPLAARFGFALALSVTVWVVLGIYALERVELDNALARRILAALAILSIVLLHLFPGQPHRGDHPSLAPLHWVLGLASYGLFGAALLHAAFWQVSERRLRDRRQATTAGHFGIPLLKLESLTLRFVGVGFAVLTGTLVLGVLFSSPWRWDHKTVFAVLSWGVFAVLLLGRRLRGWRGRQVISWLYTGSLLLLLSYAGSRFVLEVLLQRPPGTA